MTPTLLQGHPEHSEGSAVFLLLILFAAGAAAQTASIYSLPAEPPARATKSTQSILFDLKAANDVRLQGQPLYVESITIVGQVEAPKKSVEKRFADSLNGPAAAGMLEFKHGSNVPCLSLASTRPDIGSWFTPLTGCPR